MKPLQWIRGQRTSRTATAVLGLAALAPVLLLLAKGIAALPADVRVSGDPAVTELYTLRATAGDQWLGPYSRFGFHHPGPLLFFAFAPLYTLLGKSYAALSVGALAINLVSLLGITAVVLRVAGRLRACWTLATLAAYVLYLQPGLLVSAWNPDVAVAPLALSLVALTAATAGFTVYLPVAAAAGSLAVQSHLTSAAPVAVAGLVSATVLVFGHRQLRAEETGRKRALMRHLLLTAIVLAVAWAPSAFEQLRDTPGNVALIVRYLHERHEGQTPGTAIAAIARQTSGFLLSPLGVNGQALPTGALARAAEVLCGVQLTLLLIGTWLGWVRRDSFVAAACATAALLFVVAATVTLRISGPLWPYLTRWVAALGLLGWIAVAAAFTPRGRARVGWSGVHVLACAVLVSGFAVPGVREAARFPVLSTYIASAWPDQLSKRTVEALAARSVQHPHLRILSNRSWEQAASIVLQCEKAGRGVTVDSDWVFMFGEGCRLREPDDGAVLVAPSGLATVLARQPGFEVLAAGGEDTALLATYGSAGAGVVDMGTPAVEAYLRGGFSGAENERGGGFRWSEGPVSWLRLPASLGSPHRLRFMACPLEVPGVRESVTVELNGVRLAVLTMRRGWAVYSVPVPGAVVRTQNLIAFQYSSVRSPHEISGADDRRQLAVRFRWISLGESPANSTEGAPTIEGHFHPGTTSRPPAEPRAN